MLEENFDICCWIFFPFNFSNQLQKKSIKKNNKKGNENWEYRAAPDRFTSSCLNQGF